MSIDVLEYLCHMVAGRVADLLQGSFKRERSCPPNSRSDEWQAHARPQLRPEAKSYGALSHMEPPLTPRLCGNQGSYGLGSDRDVTETPFACPMSRVGGVAILRQFPPFGLSWFSQPLSEFRDYSLVSASEGPLPPIIIRKAAVPLS